MPKTSQKFPKASGKALKMLVNTNTVKDRNQADRERFRGNADESSTRQLACITQYIAPRNVNVPMMPTLDNSLTIRS